MDALEFLKEKKRMCNSYSVPCNYCGDCPLVESYCVINNTTSDEDLKKMITAVEQWSKDHPRKTRQSVFLEQWPKAVISNGVLDLPPCNIDQSLYDIQRCKNTDCYECRHKFWSQEVE